MSFYMASRKRSPALGTCVFWACFRLMALERRKAFVRLKMPQGDF